jgi:hypothetical protein
MLKDVSARKVGETALDGAGLPARTLARARAEPLELFTV